MWSSIGRINVNLFLEDDIFAAHEESNSPGPYRPLPDSCHCTDAAENLY
jgi:hypothetical protein